MMTTKNYALPPANKLTITMARGVRWPPSNLEAPKKRPKKYPLYRTAALHDNRGRKLLHSEAKFSDRLSCSSGATTAHTV